jgi:hypothetical protein
VAKVLHLFRAPKRRVAMEELAAAQVTDRGLSCRLSGLGGDGLMLERGGVGRTVFFLGALFPAERLLGRNHPLKAAVLVHDRLKEVRISRDQG